ncbi:MAG TPA: DUF3536 domain-containing protein [Salinimicrobium sp.]|nr:DUF3536 domain-containing protein [Salinimicrobium sp.]
MNLYQDQMSSFHSDPWELRNKYIEVILDRDRENVERFLKENFQQELSGEEKTNLLKLLEMQYHCMLMYTSCGWFFDEVTGIESMQDIFYATRAIQLAKEISGNNLEPGFLERLTRIKSNLPEYKSAQDAYNKFVKPMVIDMIRIGAHYAVSSVFEEFPEKVSLYNFTAKVRTKHFYEAGKQKLVIGHTEFRSGITWEKINIAYAVLHLGNHHLVGGVREYIGAEALEEVHSKASEYFKKGNVYEIFNMMDSYFGNHNYSFWHLFRDEQRSIMNLVMENTLKTAEGALQLLYENTYPLLQTFHGLNMEVPNRLQLPVDIAINNQLTEVLQEKNFKLDHFRKLINSAEIIYANLDIVTLNFLSDEKLTSLMLKFSEDIENIVLLKEINSFLTLLQKGPVQPVEWEAQNIAFRIKGGKYAEISGNNGENENAEQWLSEFSELARNLNLVI